MSGSQDYYEVLEVPRNATPQQIREAYRRLALLNHPDKDPGNPNLVQKFQVIADAYTVLYDPERRKEYDARRRTRNNHVDPNRLFADAFDELLRPEMERVGRQNKGTSYAAIGGASGAGLGFIIANVPGAVIGTVVGGALGVIRDRKGMSLVDAFNQLPAETRKEIIHVVTTAFMGGAVGLAREHFGIGTSTESASRTHS
ncbi:DnaJ-domain-containing protein [Gonapodya prolifera JEL478]|uniref:DnaJ-domain-containing protein n=1 Tax=Gonapodya prolifera (strain JEL478) TaxID=1344416 RepID=A0A139AY08_GONPJ|nr:DnaJ-domain-containing protein [Gonapodya prolifera JEL478]|eukprot:KXS21453.1 DnaJ-domain-containing protein [Gonapodya prolifera JEL478]